MEMTQDDDPEDIFHDALVSVFGDVAESHGEPGKRFCYNAPYGYPPSAAALASLDVLLFVLYLSKSAALNQCISGPSLFA